MTAHSKPTRRAGALRWILYLAVTAASVLVLGGLIAAIGEKRAIAAVHALHYRARVVSITKGTQPGHYAVRMTFDTTEGVILPGKLMFSVSAETESGPVRLIEKGMKPSSGSYTYRRWPPIFTSFPSRNNAWVAVAIRPVGVWPTASLVASYAVRLPQSVDRLHLTAKVWRHDGVLLPRTVRRMPALFRVSSALPGSSARRSGSIYFVEWRVPPPTTLTTIDLGWHELRAVGKP